MKKLLLTLPLVLLASVASAGVTFSGLLLNNPTSQDGTNPLTGLAANWYSDQSGAFAAAILANNTDVITAAANPFYTSTGLPNGLYTGAFNIDALSGSFAAGDSFVVIVDDAHLFTNGSWIAPSEGGTQSILPGGGAAAMSVPEPSTYALLAGFAAFIFVAIRRRNS